MSSQSTRVKAEFAALSLIVDKRLSTGSSTETVPFYFPAPTALSDAAATITVAQIKTGILTMTPTTSRTITLPTATLMSAFLDEAGKCIDIAVINSGADATAIVVAPGTGGTLVGAGTVRDSDATAAPAAGSAIFRIRMTDVSTPAYILYRLS
jgi:hypothetical protein